jgi:hypothetical protein
MVVKCEMGKRNQYANFEKMALSIDSVVDGMCSWKLEVFQEYLR